MDPFDLPLTLRTAAGDTDVVLSLPGPTTVAVVLPQIRAAANLAADAPLYLGSGEIDGDLQLGASPLLAGTVLASEPDPEPEVDAPIRLSCISGPDAGASVPLTKDRVLIGRDGRCDLRLDDPALSRRHALVRAGPDGVEISDLGSANGIKLDGEPRERKRQVVPHGGLIRMGGSVLRSGIDSEPPLLLTPDGKGRMSVARPARVQPPFRVDLPPAVGEAPARARRPLPLMAALLGGVAGVAIAVMTGMWTFLLLAALGPATMLITSVGDRVTGRRSHRRAGADHRQALAQDTVAIAAALAADRLDAWDRYPDPATLLCRVRAAGHRLWERRPGDADFLRVTLGIGDRPSRIDRLEPPLVGEVPITIGLAQAGVLGVAGAPRSVLRHLLAQVVALQAPSDIRLVVCSVASDLQVVRNTPHVAGNGSLGEILSSETEVAQLLGELTGPRAGGITTVLVLDGAHRWRQVPGMKQVLSSAATQADPRAALTESSSTDRASPVVAICLDDSLQALPAECAVLVTAAGGSLLVDGGLVRTEAEMMGVDQDYLEVLSRCLAGLRDPDTVGGSVPSRVSLAQLDKGVPDVAGVRRRWAAPRLAAVLGAGGSGPVELDLSASGPHLLLAGTTGAGKSELLQTLVAGLALAAPPDHTALLLVDYKGGAAFADLARLPHTTGMVTDLDSELALRALTSLRAEVRRREGILAGAGAADLPDLRRRQHPEVFAHLVIVVDEFATLAAELPEFLTGLVDVAQRGRSLGVHLILATQRPAGVLSPAVRSNISARICLRVTDDADSIDVIDVPDAARLPSSLPGRALLRTDRGTCVMFQTARVTVAPALKTTVRLRDVGRSEQRSSDAPTELDQLIAAVTEAAVDRPIPRPAWRPALPPMLPAEPHLQGVIALMDEPETASQHGLEQPSGSVLMAGPPGSGRTAALRRLAHCWATTGAEILQVDSGGQLCDVADWSCTSTGLNGSDPLLVQRLVSRLHQVMVERAGIPGPDILLVLDGWETITGPLDLLDFGTSIGQLSELIGRGPASGIRVAVAAESRIAHHRVAGFFGTRILLGVDGRGDVRTGKPPGRCRIGDLEGQLIFDPTPTNPPPLRSDRQRLVIRPLPHAASASDLPPSTSNAVVLGLGGDAADPQGIDLTGPGGGLLVAGPRRSGVSTALTTLARGAALSGIRVIRAIRQPLNQLEGVEDVDIRPGPGDLEQMLIDHEGALLLITDGIEDDDPVSPLLGRFLTAAGHGQYLALGVRLDRALRSHRGLIAETATFRTGLLLHADAADGLLLDVKLPRRRGPQPPGRGHLVCSGEAIGIQIGR